MKNNIVRFYHSIDLPTTPDNTNFEPHLHNEYEILFVYSIENAFFNISGLRYTLKSFDLVFINPATLHNLNIPYNQNYERCGLYFSEDAIPNELKSTVKNFNYIYHIDDKSKPLFKIIDSISDAEKEFPKNEFDAYLPSALVQLLYHLKHSTSNEESVGTSNSTIDKILEYIDKHITEPLNADVIAEQCFVSKSWLSHSFKEYLGISLKKYVNQKKMLAIEQLIPTGISITHLTEQYSYNNYTTFFRQYKQYSGKKPRSNKNLRKK